MAERLRGRAGVKQRARRLTLFPLCQRCREQGRIKPTEIIDHIVPLALGGEDVDDNCRGLCTDCHVVVTAEQFGRKPKPTYGLDGWPTG